MRTALHRTACLALATCAVAACGDRSERRGGVVVTIEVDAPGMTNDEVERLVGVPIEAVLTDVSGVRSIRTLSLAARATVGLQLSAGVDVLRTRATISQRLAQATLPDGVHASLGSLPAGGEAYYVLRADRATLAELRALHDHLIRPRLVAVAGVVDVAGCGGAIATIEIGVHAERLRGFDLSAREVASALSQAMDAAGGGHVVAEGAGDVIVRGAGRALDDLGTWPLTSGADRVPVMLRDVADIQRRDRPAPCQVVLDDGTAAVSSRVRYRSLSASREVEARLGELRAALPPGVRLDRFGRDEERGAVLGFRLASQPSDDGDALWRLAQRAARVANEVDGVERVMAQIGVEAGLTERLPGEIDVLVEIASDRHATSGAPIMARLRSLPGVTARRLARSASAHVVLALTGADREALAATAGRLRDVVAEIAGIEVAITLGTATAPRTAIVMDRSRMAVLGITAAEVTDAIRMAMDGVEVGELMEGDRRLPIKLRWAEVGREPRHLARIPLRAPDGSWIGLQDVASIALDELPVALLRTDGAPSMTVWIEMAAGQADRVKAEIRRRIAGIPLPPGQLVTLR